MKIYFAGSIRGGRDDVILYLEIIDLLKNYGEVLTEHIGNKELSSIGEQTVTDQDIYQRDMTWLKTADIVVAEVSTASLGVGYEIGQSEIMQKPLLCLYRQQPEKRLSAMINGNPNILVKRYKNIGDIISIFQEFFSAHQSARIDSQTELQSQAA